MTDGTQTVDLVGLVAEDVTLAAQADHIITRRAEIRAMLLAALPVGTTTIAGCTVSVRAGAKRLDLKRLEFAYPFTQHPELFKATIDTTLVRAHLAPVALERFTTQGESTLSIK